MQPAVSVIILNYNGSQYLEKFLPKLILYSSSAKIVVADNNSSDNSCLLISENFPEVELIQLEQNYGFAQGYNLALAQVKADYYIILNNDVEVTENWLTPILDCLQQANVGACQPKIKSHLQKEYFEYAGAAGGYIDSLGYPFCAGRIFEQFEKDNGQYDSERNIFWATGACLGIKASIFQEINGFDASFFAHMEEIDLCWRIQKLGYTIKYTAKSTVYHVGGGTLTKENPFKTYLNFRNNLKMILKNIPTSKAILVIILKLILDGLAGFQYLLKGQWRNTLAIIRAHLAFYSAIPTILANKKSTANGTSKIETIYPKSIVFQYFLHKKYKFTELKWLPKTPKQ
jgi:GT2 family glycosyltransferase